MRQMRASRREFLSRAGAYGMAGALGGCATTTRQAQAPAHKERMPRDSQTRRSSAKTLPHRRVLGANDRVQCAFIGVGRRASSLLQEVLKRNDADVVAIADAYDVWRDRAVHWCKEKRAKVGDYVRFEDMLDKEKLDAVFIGAPDHVHVPAILAAIDLGNDVYTEKPMTLTWQDAKDVQERVKHTGAVLQVGTQLRSTDIYAKAREMVQSGGIGKVVGVRVNRSSTETGLAGSPPAEANSTNVHWDVFLRDTQPYPFDLVRYFNWRRFKEYSNGYTGDLMTHHLDICHFITGCGMPLRVMSMGGIYWLKDGRTRPDTVCALLEYPEEFIFNYSTITANGHYGLVERYIGTEGVIEIRDMSEMSLFKNEIEDVTKSAGLNDAAHIANFLECVRSRETPVASVDAGFMAAACAHMAVLSQESGESAKWDPTAGAVVV